MSPQSTTRSTPPSASAMRPRTAGQSHKLSWVSDTRPMRIARSSRARLFAHRAVYTRRPVSKRSCHWTVEHVFDNLDPWGSAIRRSRGSSSSTSSLIGVLTAVLRARRRGRTPVATARHGRAGVSPTSRRRPSSGAPMRCPTPSCTATRTSASSTVRAIPKSSRKKRRASASKRSRSPTTTASTAWSASPKPRARSACPPCSAPSSRSVRPAPQNGVADPAGSHMIVLAAGPDGYARLAPRDQPRADGGGEGRAAHFARSARRREPHERRPPLGRLVGAQRLSERCGVLRARRATARPQPSASCSASSTRSAVDRVAVELWDHGDPLDSVRNDALAEIAIRAGVVCVATNNVHYATPARAPARDCARRGAGTKRRSTRSTAGFRRARARTCAPASEQARRFARYPGVVEAAAELGRACAFDLALVAPDLPPFPCPTRHDEMSWLRALTWRGAERRYGTRGVERVPGAYAQIEHELEVIETLGFPGYFLIVWDSSSSAGEPTSTAKGGARLRTRRSATRSASPTPTQCRSACCSSGSCRPSVTARPTSTSTSRAIVAKR